MQDMLGCRESTGYQVNEIFIFKTILSNYDFLISRYILIIISS